MERWRTNQKQSIRVLVVVILWCVFLCHSTSVWSRDKGNKVSRNASSGTKAKGIIKIATIGHRPLNVDVNTEPQKVVDKMIAHWRSRFAQVLPDRPDLIVVPEACN